MTRRPPRAESRPLAHDSSAVRDTQESRASAGRAFAELQPRDRRILHLRFVEDLTQSEIGARVGISQMQVSRILARSARALRAAATEPD